MADWVPPSHRAGAAIDAPTAVERAKMFEAAANSNAATAPPPAAQFRGRAATAAATVRVAQAPPAAVAAEPEPEGEEAVELTSKSRFAPVTEEDVVVCV